MKTKQKDIYVYPVIFRNEGEKGIAILVPDLDVATCAETEEKAFLASRELISITIMGLEEDGERIPPASSVSEIALEKKRYGQSYRCFYACRPLGKQK